MNDEYDNARTDREMLNKLASEPGSDGAGPAGDSQYTFTFASMDLPGVDELTALSRAAAQALEAQGHGGPFSVTITVTCRPKPGDTGCEPQLWDDGGPR
jgi:hypothetical protein